MPKKKAQQVTLVGVRGAKLPVSECLLVDETTDNFVVQTVKKTRGQAPNKLVTYTLPKSLVQYYFSEEDATDDVDVPVATTKAAPKKAAAKKAAAPKKGTPKKRGRPPGSKNKAKATAKKKAAPKKAAEPKKGTPKKRGRPAGSKNKAKAAGDAAPKKRGRPAGSKNKPKGDEDSAPKKRGRPAGSKNKPKAAATESRKASRAESLFDESF